MLDENSSPLKLNLKDLKNQHEALIGNHTPTPYGSVAGGRGKYSARNKANVLHNLTQRSFISRKRSQDASQNGLIPIEYREKLSAYDIEKFKPYLERQSLRGSPSPRQAGSVGSKQRFDSPGGKDLLNDIEVRKSFLGG